MPAIRALIVNAMIIAVSMENGARTNIRSSIIYAFCTFVTSVVSLVTSPGGEYLSIFENENVWIFANMALRRFLAKPAEAFEPSTPPIMPAKSPASASRSIQVPVSVIACMLPPLTPLSIMVAMSRGISVSTTTSSIMKTGVRSDARLYSFTSFNSVRII